MERGVNSFTSLLVRCGSFAVFGGFVGWKRFAMRYSNFRRFVGLLVASEALRVLQENLMNNMGR
jgi:hypothetical protein